ncbi:hypothetical protein MRQ36_19450 [Micromonospora sp. R77]|uniref:hypothetical protein n=1 Tax=Micromonospora sp. R77 TaxID=2925836 RepID=UPI001F615E84|nr:hypothetical protein [Micromonospora sp. R77]MCI4064631.1 hypothetical protein [Micromonospora sp. R77]
MTTRRGEAAALAGLLAVAGVTHFARPGFYDPIVPRALAGPARFWTYASGVAELAVAAAVAHDDPPDRRPGRGRPLRRRPAGQRADGPRLAAAERRGASRRLRPAAVAGPADLVGGPGGPRPVATPVMAEPGRGQDLPALLS